MSFLVVACGLLGCGMQTLSCGMHAGSSSLTRDQTQAPCIGSVESYPLDHQGSAHYHFSLRLSHIENANSKPSVQQSRPVNYGWPRQTSTQVLTSKESGDGKVPSQSSSHGGISGKNIHPQKQCRPLSKSESFACHRVTTSIAVFHTKNGTIVTQRRPLCPFLALPGEQGIF